MSSRGLPNCPPDTLAAQCTAELLQAIAELLALAFFFCLLRAFGSACSLTKSIQGKIRVEASSCIKATERKRPKATCPSAAIVRKGEFSLCMKNTIIVHWETWRGVLHLCRAHSTASGLIRAILATPVILMCPTSQSVDWNPDSLFLMPAQFLLEAIWVNSCPINLQWPVGIGHQISGGSRNFCFSITILKITLLENPV